MRIIPDPETLDGVDYQLAEPSHETRVTLPALTMAERERPHAFKPGIWEPDRCTVCWGFDFHLVHDMEAFVDE